MTTNSELLLPVGNITMALAAIHNGADAIYVGMPGFNARGRTHDHTLEELAEIIEMCHLYNVKVNVAFNILIFQDEIELAINTLKNVLKLSPDALIVQDIGLIKLIKTIAPKQVIHGSTQMTITNHEAIELLNDLDIKRFVLGRENTLNEISNIKQNTNKELEVFVHGALCVAYSGQCFTSEALGGRSANRGQCAQSCRFDYELYVDNQKKELVDQKYLVSPQDLCGINEIPKLLEIGVDSFKVEGRLKGPEYVSSVASSYRQKIDDQEKSINNKSKLAMELSYSRGFYSGWLNGVAHQELVHGKFSSNRGKLVGKVVNTSHHSLIIESDIDILPGDGILFTNNKDEIGGNVYQVERTPLGFKVSFSKDFNYSNIKNNYLVYLTARDSLYKELQKSYTQKEKLKKIPIDLKIKGSMGMPIVLKAKEGNFEITIQTDLLLEEAKNQSLTKELVLSHLSGLTNTVYKINSCEYEISKNLFIHNKVIKELKQKMVQELNTERLKRPKLEINNYVQAKKQIAKNTQSKLSILVRKLEQVQALVIFFTNEPLYRNSVSKIIIDFEFGRDFTKAIEIIKELNIEATIATTRILKPGEYHNFKQIERAMPDSILIRNLGALHYFQNKEFKLYGDFSLNATNSFTIDYLLSKGLESQCASYDMNAKQLEELLKYTDASKVEITAHQYMPEFHMEHCVFAAFLSKGNSFKDCGKPCEKHQVHLKDMYGNIHEIKADQECRNTMFKSVPQSALNLIPAWQSLGVNQFRFEALHENDEELISKLKIYLDVLINKKTSQQGYHEINHYENYGVTTGQLLKTKKYKDKKKRLHSSVKNKE